MKTRYLCPHCKSVISINEDIVLTATNSKDEKGIVLLHTKIGNYTSKKSTDFNVKDGEDIDFFCPICSKSLEYKFKLGLVCLLFIDEFEKESTVIFSKIYQKQCTYQIIDKKVYSYGECAKKFSNPEWFL